MFDESNVQRTVKDKVLCERRSRRSPLLLELPLTGGGRAGIDESNVQRTLKYKDLCELVS